MKRTYSYVSPADIRSRATGRPAGTVVACRADVLRWARQTDQPIAGGELLAATFVISLDGRLLVADRRSEHVACAAGEDVTAAGEMFFVTEGLDVSVSEVSNLSTGYCPEPECCAAVAEALDRAGLVHPGGFTTTCTFRLCTHCGQRNVVKDAWFQCDVCGRDLDRHWNFG